MKLSLKVTKQISLLHESEIQSFLHRASAFNHHTKQGQTTTPLVICHKEIDFCATVITSRDGLECRSYTYLSQVAYVTGSYVNTLLGLIALYHLEEEWKFQHLPHAL